MGSMESVPRGILHKTIWKKSLNSGKAVGESVALMERGELKRVCRSRVEGVDFHSCSLLCCKQGFTVLLFGHWFDYYTKYPVFTETASFSKPRSSAATAITPDVVPPALFLTPY